MAAIDETLDPRGTVVPADPRRSPAVELRDVTVLKAGDRPRQGLGGSAR
jgi:hypothetical protein